MKKFLLSILCLVAMAVTGYATEATVTMADLGYANAAEITAITVDENVAITFAQGTNSSSVPKYYTTGNAARTYAGNVITFSCSAGNMTEIVFNISDNGLKRLTDAIPSTGSSVVSAADKTITWTGDAAEVAFTVGATADYGTEAGKPGQIHIASVDVTYAASSVVANVATPTFTVEAGTYGTKQSVGIECESEGAVIYYTLDGTTPDNTATLYEAPIELNSKTTVKAIAYVGEEASNVASASYDFHLDGKLTFVTAPIFASDMQGKIEWTTEDWASNSVNYLTTLDGTVPTVDNKWNTGTGKSRILPMYTWKKDTVVTVSVRAEKDGIYSDTFKQTFYIHYAKTLNIYRAVSEMAAGNYVIAGENTLMLPIDGKGQNHGYGYTVDATITNGLASAFGLFEFAFEATDGGYFIKDSKGQYLGSEGTYKSFQIYKDNTAAGAVWSVELQANGVAKITNKGNGRWIQWDSQYKNWATFDKDNGTFMPTLAAAYTPVVTITPEANATVESIDKITVTCPDGISSSTKFNYCSLQGSSSTTGVVAANQVDANTVELVLESPVTENGTYTFVLYKEVLTIAPETINQKYPSATQYIEYTISNNEEVAAIVVTPENESIHKSLQHFTFDYEKGIAVNGLFGGQAPFLGYTDPATGASSTVALTPTAATETSVTLSTDEPQTVDGYYTLIVPAEYFILAGSRPNDAIMNQYMVSAINPNAMNIVSVDPEQGEVTSLKKIVIMFDAEINVAPETWTITDANGTVYAAQYTSPADLGFMGIQIELKEAITAEGTYTLNIPAGSIEEYMGNKKVEEQTLTWTIVAGGEVEADYIFNAEDHNIGTYETLTDGIYTFIMGEKSTKPWTIDANSKSFSNGIKTTQRIKAESDKNYLTANIPEAGKLVFAVMSSSSSATDRTLSVVQNDVELYGKVVCDANDKIDGVYNVHEVAVEAGLATITMKGALNFSYIEFIPTGGDTPETPATATWSMEEGQVVETFESVDLTINIEGVESAKPKNTYGCTYFYEKNAEGEWQLVVAGPCQAGYMDAAVNGTTITFSIDPACYSKDYISPFSRKGEYRIVVPAGDLYFNGDRTNVSTEEYVLNFTIDNDFVEPVEIDAAFTADPEENTTIKEIREIVITFTEYDAISVAEPDFVNGSNIPMVKMYDDFFESYNGAGYIFARAGEAANQLVLYVDPQYAGGLESYSVEGQYEIQVPAGVVYFGQDRNKEFALHYTVGEEKLAVVSSTPAEGQEVESFSEMIVEFNKPVAHVDKTFSLYNADGTKVSSLSVEMIDPVGQIQVGFPPANKPLAYKVRFYTAEPVTAAGNYYVNMPADAFTIEGFGEYSVKTTINFSVKASTPVVPTTATWSMEEGQVVETFESVDLTINIEGVESAKPKNTYGCTYFYEKNAEGEWQLVVGGACEAGYMDAAMSGTTITFSIDPICYSKDFISPFSRKGEYRIVVPAGDLYFNGDRTNVSTEEYVLNFTIDNDFVEPVEIDAAFTADPEENTTIKEIREIVITFTEYDAITVAEPDFVNGSNIPMVKMYDDFFESYNGAGYILARAGEAANQLVLYVDPQLNGGLDSYNVEGQYQISVPAGVVYFGQDRNKEFKLHYTVGQEKLAVVSSTPAEGQEVESFSEMIVEFNKPVAHVDKTFSLYNADGTKVSSLSVEMIDPVGQIQVGFPPANKPLAYKVRLYTAEPVTAAGNYYVNMPADAFAIEGFGEYSVKTTINFSVVTPALAIVGTTPAEGQEVESFSEMIVEFNKPVADFGKTISLYNADGTKVSSLSIEMIDPVGQIQVGYPPVNKPLANKVRLYTAEPVTAEGDYYVTMPTDAFVTEGFGEYTVKTTINFSVKAAAVEEIYIVKSTPANNEVIAALKEIVVEFNTDIEIGISPNVYNTANGLCMSTTSIAYSDEEGVTYPGNVARIILTSPIEASGTYDVVFEANSILSWPYGDIMNKELRLTFNITGTGIKNIQADPQLGYVVYDMNGILVMQTMNAADIDRLNNGLYIINGVKVLINK